MNIALGKEYQEWIDDAVRSGRYQSETDAVEDALRGKMEQDEIERLRERIRLSEEQIARGEVIVADDAYFDKIRERIRQVAAEARRQ